MLAGGPRDLSSCQDQQQAFDQATFTQFSYIGYDYIGCDYMITATLKMAAVFEPITADSLHIP